MDFQLNVFKKMYCAVPMTPLYMDGRRVLPDDSQRIVNHSPDGFAWGYGGSGPAQLALAILMCVFPVSIARKYYQKFKFDIVAKQDKDGEFILLWPDFEKWVAENIAECQESK